MLKLRWRWRARSLTGQRTLSSWLALSDIYIDTVRALSRINFCCFQSVGVELPRGVASIFVVPCKIEYIKIILILNIIHLLYLLYLFCLFLAELVVMNCQETLFFLFRQVETGRFTVGSFGIHGIRGLLPPSPTPWDVLYWQCLESQVVYHNFILYAGIVCSVATKSNQKPSPWTSTRVKTEDFQHKSLNVLVLEPSTYSLPSRDLT